MRLLWVAPIEFGKTIHQVGELGTAAALSRKSWEIDFLSIEWRGDSSAFLNKLGFGSHVVRRSTIPGLGGLSFNRSIKRALPRIVQKGNYDAILVEWPGALGVLRGLKKMNQLGIKCPPFLFEDRSPPASGTILGLLQWIHYDMSWKHVARMADSIEVLVPGLESFVRNRFGDLPKMVHCPSGVDVNRFVPEFTKLESKIRVVYHGRLDSNRGLERIEEFGKRIIELGYDIEITIFGRGPLARKFQKMSNRLNWLNFLGEVDFDEVPSIIAKNHLGILPLPDRLPWNVGSPLKLMEYASSGLPILATDVEGCIPFSEKDWVCLADNKDPINQWCNFVSLITENPEKYKSMAKKARTDAEMELTWDHAVVDLDSELNRISVS